MTDNIFKLELIRNKFLVGFAVFWFLALSLSFFYPGALDSWNIINNTIRFENFNSYYDTTGVGFSLEALYALFSLFMGEGFAFVSLSFAAFILFIYINFVIYYSYSSNFKKSLILILMAMPFYLPQLGGIYWDHLGVLFSLIALCLLTKKLTITRTVLLSLVFCLLFFNKQNSGFIFLMVIVVSALLTNKRFSYISIINLIFFFSLFSICLHLFTFKNLNILSTINLHLSTMLGYLQENQLDVGQINLKYIYGRAFPIFTKGFYAEFFPLATPQALLVSFIHGFIVWKGIQSLFKRDRGDLFLFISLIGIHFASVLLWGRNWSDTYSLLPLVFFLSLGKEIRFKNLIPIFLLFLIMSFIVLRSLFASLTYNISSPVYPLGYSSEVINRVEDLSKTDFIDIQNYLISKNPDCIFTLGYAAYPFVTYEKEICSDEVQVVQSYAVLGESVETLTSSFRSALTQGKRILVLNSCEETESIHVCREKADIVFYRKLDSVYKDNLPMKDSVGTYHIYHNIEKDTD